MTYMEKIKEATAYIQSKTSFKPQFGIILGTGLGALVEKIDVEAEIAYEGIPNFPVSTVESHRGKTDFWKTFREKCSGYARAFSLL